jgi:hypothetical protein
MRIAARSTPSTTLNGVTRLPITIDTSERLLALGMVLT